jgi:hypothetical protein
MKGKDTPRGSSWTINPTVPSAIRTSPASRRMSLRATPLHGGQAEHSHDEPDHAEPQCGDEDADCAGEAEVAEEIVPASSREHESDDEDGDGEGEREEGDSIRRVARNGHEPDETEEKGGDAEEHGARLQLAATPTQSTILRSAR